MLLTSYPQAGNGGSNVTVDGRVFASKASPGASFSDLRSGTGTSITAQATSDVSYAVELAAGTTSNLYLRLAKCFFTFDTSSIGSGDITAVTFNFYTSSRGSTLGTATMHIVASTQALDNTVSNTDYLSVGSTSLGSIGINSTEITLNAFNAISIDTTAINKTGVTKLCAVLGWDLNNSFTGTWLSSGYARVYIRQADYADSQYHPYLEVTYENGTKNKYQMIL